MLARCSIDGLLGLGRRQPKLHVLYNNAYVSRLEQPSASELRANKGLDVAWSLCSGIMYPTVPDAKTADGYELQFGTNVLGETGNPQEGWGGEVWHGTN
jgi:hypothetical protein